MGENFNLPGATELNQLVDDSTYIPAGGGLGSVVTIQQAGFLKKLRGWLDSDVLQTVSTLAALKSTWGPLGGSLERIRATVHGRKPFFDLSGLGLQVYNEVNNPDGSVFAPHANMTVALLPADVNMAESTHLTSHTFGVVDVATYVVNCPFELPFGMPVWMTRLIKLGSDYIPVQAEEEVGLWHLQDQQTRMEIATNFFPAGIATATDPQAPYNSADIVATWSPIENRIRWERELYSVPSSMDELPDQSFIHQVIEYNQPIVNSAFRFPIPQVGSLLRAIFIFHDNEVGHCLVDWAATMPTATIALTYGASDRPIVRPMWAMVSDWLHDYNRYPPHGAVVFDFYKAGREAARLARDTDRIANLAFEGVTTGLVTGTCRIILESLVPNRVA